MTTSRDTQRAERIAADEEGVARAGRALAAGRLVAFPTETVYGLGAHALDEAAVAAIFAAKGRPATDPLIVHVGDAAAARALARLVPGGVEERLFDGLSTLWPAPLTLVVTADGRVPSRVRAGGPSVGLRVPAHEIARRLLAAANVPVAAPSANRFGHVSPTTAEHVLDDLGHVEGLLVLDGGACPVGIESTVARLDGDRVEVLRRGAIGLEALARVVEPLGGRVAARERVARVDEAQAAPGQLESHYAPSLPTFLLGDAPPPHATERLPLAACALLDLGGRHAALAPRVGLYRDLSPTGNAAAAMADLYTALRALEAAPVRAILLVDLAASRDERLLAMHDRLRRAASHRVAALALDGNGVLLPAIPAP